VLVGGVRVNEPLDGVNVTLLPNVQALHPQLIRAQGAEPRVAVTFQMRPFALESR
jgi:hypothetical protein